MEADRRVQRKKATFGRVSINDCGPRSEKKHIKPDHKRQLSLKPMWNAVDVVLWTAIKRGHSATCTGIKYNPNRSINVGPMLNAGIATKQAIAIHFIIL